MVSSTRSTSARTISARRSERSTTAPAGMANSIHGREPAKGTSAIRSGSRVNSVANHGTASAETEPRAAEKTCHSDSKPVVDYSYTLFQAVATTG